jgi:hypothetical protein
MQGWTSSLTGLTRSVREINDSAVSTCGEDSSCSVVVEAKVGSSTLPYPEDSSRRLSTEQMLRSKLSPSRDRVSVRRCGERQVATVMKGTDSQQPERLDAAQPIEDQ